jgi:hypothetical protein
METHAGVNSNGVAFVDTFQEALTVPHLHVTLPHNTPLNSIEETLADACCGLLLGDRPPVFVDRKHHVAVIPIPAERIERVLYKSYIIHKPTGSRYQCSFSEGTSKAVAQKRISIELPGAKFAWLKAQSHIRDRLYSYEPLIRVNWQQCTGAEMCKIHLHYSSEDESTLHEVESLRSWIVAEADKVIIRSFPLYVPPRNRYPLSSDAKFREIAYHHHVSLWTRTMKDSPIGNEWCTFATDDAEQMEATLASYREYGMNTKWGAKSSASSPSQSPPESVASSPIAGGLAQRSLPVSSLPAAAERTSTPHPVNSDLSMIRSPAMMALESPALPPGLNLGAIQSTPSFDRTPYMPSLYDASSNAWDRFLMPTDLFAAGTPAASYASSYTAPDFNLLFQSTHVPDLFASLPEEASRHYNALTDSYSG